jgi:UDP-glucuronate decarboxylase
MFRDEKYWQYIDAILQQLKLDKSMKQGTILISGVSGMIGTVLTDILLRANEIGDSSYCVRGIGRNMSHMQEMLGRYAGRNDFEFWQCDINNAITDVGEIDYILHCASNTHPVDYSGDPIGTIASNVMGTSNLLQYAVQHQCKRFVFLSSVEVYGENRGDVEKFDEDYCGYINCNTLRAGYPESKRTGETLCQAYGKQYKLDFVIPRLCRVYGPTMSLRDSKAIAQFIKNAANGEDIVLKSEGKQLYSYIDAFQAASAILYIMFWGTQQEAYNIASNQGDWYMKDLAQMIADVVGQRVVYDLPNEREKAGFSKATKAVLDNTKLRALGWTDTLDCRELLDYTIKVVQRRM